MDIKKLNSILHTVARCFLATVMLAFAIAEIMETQFASAPSTWDKSVG
jgi:hypothetical protein